MPEYRKAIVAGIAGIVGALGVAVSVSADNEFSLNDSMAILFAGFTAVASAIGVYVTPNEPESG